MSKLLERAKVKLENAQNDYDKIQKSDAYLDDCCFNLQQAIEFTLKYIVEMNFASFCLYFKIWILTYLKWLHYISSGQCCSKGLSGDE